MGEVNAGMLGATALDEPVVATSVPTTIVTRSVYDTAYTMLAQRSIHASRLVRENAEVVSALRAVAQWVIGFCELKAVSADEVVVEKSMTPEGAIALHIHLRSEDYG